MKCTAKAIKSWGRLCSVLKTAAHEIIRREKLLLTPKKEEGINNPERALTKHRENPEY